MSEQLIPQPHGGALKRGGKHFGHNEARGRHAIAQREFFQALATDAAHVKALKAILRNPDHAHFPAVIAHVYDRAWGKPKESVEVSATLGGVIEHQPLTILLPQLNPAPVPPAPQAIAGPPLAAIALPDPAWAPDVAVDEA